MRQIFIYQHDKCLTHGQVKTKGQKYQTKKDCKLVQCDIWEKYNEKQNYNFTNVNTEIKFQIETHELYNSVSYMEGEKGSDMGQGQPQEDCILGSLKQFTFIVLITDSLTYAQIAFPFPLLFLSYTFAEIIIITNIY